MRNLGNIHGFFFGELDGDYILKPETMDGHILVVGGSGSGKSSCIVIPSLVTWKTRVFAIDIKGELYKNTARERPNAKVFDPTDPNAYGYDPFYVLQNADDQAQEAEAIALALIPTPTDKRDAFWIENAQNMLTGLLLFFHNQGYSFINTMIEIQSAPIRNLIDYISDKSEIAEARIYVNAFKSMENRELAGIYGEVSRHIKIFATNKSVKNAFSQSKKITPDDLEGDSDIYFCIPQHLIEQWKHLTTLIISQFLRHFKQRPDRNAKPILFLLDEFAQLGKIDEIAGGLATLRSKNITMCLVIQELAQLEQTYDKPTMRTICGNCHFKAVLNAADTESQEYFSKLGGTYEKTKISWSRNYMPIVNFPLSSGINIYTEEKPRIKSADFGTLKNMILYTPDGVYRINKDPYYT